MERFTGLNIYVFNPIEIFLEIFLCCLGQKYLLFSINKERCLYSQKNFRGTLVNCEKRESLAQQIFQRLQQLCIIHHGVRVFHEAVLAAVCKLCVDLKTVSVKGKL